MKVLFIAGLILFSINTYAENLNAAQQKSIQKLIQNFKNNNVQAISQSIQYPLDRENPLPSIKNAKELKPRFSQVFDQKLQHKIIHSKPEDWSVMGWQGIMLDSGEIWVSNVDDAPKQPIKIIAVNYSSEAEQKLRSQLLQKQKRQLHPLIQKFEEPELLIKTKDYLIRIDQLNATTYRYASWQKTDDQSKQPDLVLNKGTLSIEGTARNQTFEFKNGAYMYTVYQNNIGNGNSATLIVSKGNKIILKQSGNLIEY